jgi:hypothetical protein
VETQPSAAFPIGNARDDCKSCGYGEIYLAAASYPTELIVGDAYIVLVQQAELIRKLESISWTEYVVVHVVRFLWRRVLERKAPARCRDLCRGALFRA